MPRKPREHRRSLNSDESESLGFADMWAAADEEGWPYPDDDDEDTTESHFCRNGDRRRGRNDTPRHK